MKTVRVKKGDILSNAKKEVQSILDRLELIRFVDADLYLIDREILSELMEIDDVLLPFKRDTKRCEIYSINKIVNILNPTYTAYYYILNSIYRSSQVWDRAKTVDRLSREKEISKNQLLKIIRDAQNDSEYDEYALTAKNGWTWPPITEILGQIKRFYLDTKNGKYLDTFLDKPLNQFYLS